MSSRQLLKARRFLPLLATKMLGTFNDNFFKNALVFGLLYNIIPAGSMQPDLLITMTAGLLVLPFFLFSAFAGQLADKYRKDYILITLKFAELVIVGLAITGLSLNSVPLLMAMLFLFGAQSAFFNPCKFALLPEHLQREELVAGNGLISGGTYFAIMTGMVAGGLTIIIPEHGKTATMAVMALIGLSGLYTSFRIPEAKRIENSDPIDWNIAKDIYKNLHYAWNKPRLIRLSILGIAWFYLIGGTYLAQFPNYARDILQVDETVLMTGLILFSLGVMAGTTTNDKLLKGAINARFVPIASAGVALFSLIPALTPMPSRILENEQLRDFQAFFADFTAAPFILVSLFFVAFCGGLFVVPLSAIVQHYTEEQRRARMMAASSIANALFLVVSSGICYAILSSGMSVTTIFLAIAIASIFVSFYARRLKADSLNVQSSEFPAIQ